MCFVILFIKQSDMLYFYIFLMTLKVWIIKACFCNFTKSAAIGVVVKLKVEWMATRQGIQKPFYGNVILLSIRRVTLLMVSLDGGGRFLKKDGVSSLMRLSRLLTFVSGVGYENLCGE